MSVRLVDPNVRSSNICESENPHAGEYCFCRRNHSKVGQIPTVAQSYVIDISQLNECDDARKIKSEPVVIDFGSIQVETKDFRDVSILQSDYQKSFPSTLRVELTGCATGFDDVIKIIFPQRPLDIFHELECSIGPDGGGQQRQLQRTFDPDEKIKFRIVFHPELPSMMYNQAFVLWVLDSIPIKIQCNGYSEGPALCFTNQLVNFGGNYVGEEIKTVIELHNHSNCQGLFQFDIDNLRSPFKICPKSGVLHPHTKRLFEISFKPSKAQIYYKRAMCLVHHQSPQYIDLLGFSINRPVFITTPVTTILSTADTKFLPLPSPSYDEYFNNEIMWGIELSTSHIDFGFTDEKKSNKRTISLTSKLPYDVIVDWSGDESKTFMLNPQNCTLAKSSSVNFEINFHPKTTETFYSGQLEAYIYPTEKNWPSQFGSPWEMTAKDEEARKQGSKLAISIDTNKNDIAEVSRTVSQTILESQQRKSSTPKKEINEKLKKDGGDKLFRPETLCRVVAIQTVTERVKTPENSTPETSSDFEFPVWHTNPPDKRKSDPLPLTTTIRKGENELKIYLHPEKKGQRDKPKEIIEPKAEISTTSSNKKSTEIKGETSLDRILKSTTSFSEIVKSVRSANKMPKSAGSEAKSTNSRLESLKKNIKKEIVEEEEEEEIKQEEVKQLKNSHCDDRQALPLCKTISVSGHTYGSNSQPNLPMLKLPSKLCMTPTIPLAKTCRSTLLKNKGDLSIFYCATNTEGNDKSCYKIKPSHGLIYGNGYQILMMSLNPNSNNESEYHGKFNVCTNLTECRKLEVSGMARDPSIEIRFSEEPSFDQHAIICPLTIPGSQSTASIEICNTSRFQYKYQITIVRDEYAETIAESVFTVRPSHGIISMQQCMTVNWNFIPLEARKYKANYQLKFQLTENMDIFDKLYSQYEYKLIIPVFAEAKLCMLRAIPASLDFELVEMFHKKTKTFTIVNEGSSKITVHLKLYHDEWLQFYTPGLATLKPKEITLDVDETIDVEVTIRANRPDIQNFYIEAEPLLSDLEDSDVTYQCDGARLLSLTFLGDHSIMKVTDIMMITQHPTWLGEQCWGMFSLDTLNECLIPYRNCAREGHVPKIHTVKFRFPPAIQGTETANFTILLANQSVDLEGSWELQSTPPKNWADHWWEYNKKGKKPPTFNGDKDLSGLLTLLWTKKFEEPVITPKVPEGENESESEMSIAPQKLLSKPKKLPSTMQFNSPHITEKFSYSPSKGTLKAKTTQQLFFKYKYDTLGTHEMCLLFRIMPSIFVWIELSGTTLDPSQPYIQFLHDKEMHLHPISLGDLDPPVQMFWIYSAGDVPATYKVSSKPFLEVQKENFDHPVFECLNPKGKINGKSWGAIKLIFSPLEYVEYSVQLIIKGPDGTRTIVTLHGSVSNNPIVNLRPMVTRTSLRRFSIVDPEVHVTISPTHASFPHFIPTGGKASHIVFVTNNSEDREMSYSWPVTPFVGGGFIVFEPGFGVLAPKETGACMVVIKAGNVSTTFSITIRCAISDKTAWTNYEKKMVDWEADKDVPPECFDRRLGLPRKKIPIIKPEPPNYFSRVLVVTMYIGTPFGLLDSLVPYEKAKMPFSDPLRPLPSSLIQKDMPLQLLPFSNNISREVISTMLWDIVFEPSFELYARKVARRNPPTYEDYKISQEATEDDWTDSKYLPRSTIEDIMESTIVKLLQEMSNNYIANNGGKTWFKLQSIQPHALINFDNDHPTTMDHP